MRAVSLGVRGVTHKLGVELREAWLAAVVED